MPGLCSSCPPQGRFCLMNPKVSAKGGATPKAEEVEAPELVTVYEMAFTEGDAVMAKWPGTNLFFHAKVTFVRDEDNEYDVQV